MTDPIRGKVARILNSREIAINVGSDDGVSTGMYFDIMAQNAEEIRDPDTQEVLGLIQRPKIRVKITDVQEKLSLASTFKTKRVNVGGIADFRLVPANLSRAFTSPSLSRVLTPPKWVTRYETLKTQEKTWEDEDIEEEKSFVKTGDPVVQVIDPGEGEG